MEKESFEMDIIAEQLKESYIAIKVDREERPDIDSVYMTVCQMLTGSGGWPLTILMTPEQKPFFAGTYFPMHTRYGRTGLLELLQEIARGWREDRSGLLHAGEKIYSYLQKQSKEIIASTEPTKKLLLKAELQFERNYDSTNGGFSPAPKFPVPHNLLFLLRYGMLEKKQEAIEMAGETLVKMFQGGIYDHIGGGFSRYSTDEKWLVPHFEKMLYDNALLVLTYAEGYQVTKNKLFEKVARETMAYVMRELTDEFGGFYCGQDADSDGEEGKYYTFRKQEIMDVLGVDDGKRFCDWYNIKEQGNFEGKNIANLLDKPRYFMGKINSDTEIQMYGTDIAEIRIQDAKQKLYQYRKNRTLLHKDDKLLTSWNAMMIAALAKSSYVFEDDSYLSAAKRAEKFIADYLTKNGEQLLIRYRDGEAANHGQLDDYAYYAWALLELYDASYDSSYLEKAVAIVDKMISSFWDESVGGFYLYANDAEQLISRPKETYDGAIPSGNAVAAFVLARLSSLTAEKRWIEYRDKQLAYLAGVVEDYPMAHSFSLIGMLEVLYPVTEIVCVSGNRFDAKQMKKMLSECGPLHVTTLVKSNNNKEILSKIAPFTENYKIPENGTVYYICENGVCKAPFKNESEVITYFHAKQKLQV